MQQVRSFAAAEEDPAAVVCIYYGRGRAYQTHLQVGPLVIVDAHELVARLRREVCHQRRLAAGCGPLHAAQQNAVTMTCNTEMLGQIRQPSECMQPM